MKDDLHSTAVQLANAILGPPICPICREQLRRFWYKGKNTMFCLEWNGSGYGLVTNIGRALDTDTSLRRNLWHYTEEPCNGSWRHRYCVFPEDTTGLITKDMFPEEIRGWEDC